MNLIQIQTEPSRSHDLSRLLLMTRPSGRITGAVDVARSYQSGGMGGNRERDGCIREIKCLVDSIVHLRTMILISLLEYSCNGGDCRFF